MRCKFFICADKYKKVQSFIKPATSVFYFSGLGRDIRDGLNKATNKEDKKISGAKIHFIF